MPDSESALQKTPKYVRLEVDVQLADTKTSGKKIRAAGEAAAEAAAAAFTDALWVEKITYRSEFSYRWMTTAGEIATIDGEDDEV